MLFTPTSTFSARLQLSDLFTGGRSQEAQHTGTVLTRPSPGCLLGNHLTCCEAWERALPLEAGLLAPKPLLSIQSLTCLHFKLYMPQILHLPFTIFSEINLALKMFAEAIEIL